MSNTVNYFDPFFLIKFIFQKVSNHLESGYLAQLETGGVKDLDAVPGPVSSAAVRAHLLCGQLSPFNDFNNQLLKKSCFTNKHFPPYSYGNENCIILSSNWMLKKAVWTIHFDVDKNLQVLFR